MAPSSTGPDWNRISNVCAAVFVAAVLVVMYPFATCVAGVANDTHLPSGGVSASSASGGSAQQQAVRATQDMAASAGGRVAACYQGNPLPMQPLPVQFAGVLGLVGLVLFRVLGRIDHRRQVRRASRRQRTARQAIVKERSSRGESGGGHPTVGTPTGAAVSLSSGPPRVTTANKSLGLTDAHGTARGPVTGATDVLAQLDAQIAESDALEENTHLTERLGGLSASDELPDLGDMDWDKDSGAWDGAAPASEGSADALADALGLGDPADPPAGDWGRDDAAPTDDASATAAGLFSASPAAAPATPKDGGPRQDLSLERLAVPRAATVNGELVVQLLATGLDAFHDALDLAIDVIAADGSLTRAVPPAGLRDIGEYQAMPGGAEITIAWQRFSVAALEVARGATGTAAGLRVTLTGPASELTVDAPLHDVLHLRLRDQYDTPWEDLLIEVVDGLGTARFAKATSAGEFLVEGLAPGNVQVRRVDYGDLQLAGGAPVTRLSTETASVGFALPSGEMRDDAYLELIAWRANRVYVQPGPHDGDGSRERPFGSLQDAVTSIARQQGSDSLGLSEIRISSAATRPTKRVGLRHYADGRCEWLEWWRSERADTSRAWLREVDVAQVRRQADEHGDDALACDARFEGIQRVRIVGAAYAELFDALNTGRREPNDEIERAIADAPLSLLARPRAELAAAFRLAFHGLARVSLIGLHLLGGKGQSGIEIRDCAQVDLIRCWVEGFGSGMTNQSGVVAVGRGLQIDQSGSGAAENRVRIERCDLGFNEARRRSMPIRGAGAAIYNSNAVIASCYIHDNRSSQAPSCVVVDRQSSVRGSRNHRERNTQK